MNVDFIRKIASDKGIGSLSEIERILDFANGTISRWENESPSCDDLNKVAKLLATDISYLYSGVDKYDGYTDSFVAFLDILGFKEYVMKNSFKYVNDLFIDIFRFSDLLLKSPSQYFTAKMLNTVTVNTISDSIVISVPKSTTHSLEILVLIVNTIVINILREYGLFCRGGIYEGYFHSDKNIAFGPALIQAYLLEENIAVYPRIVFPRHVYDTYYSLCADKEYIEHFSDLIQLEMSDELFIADYIGFSIRRSAHDVTAGVLSSNYAYSVFWNICNLVENELACSMNKRVKDKYIYFRNYYNKTLMEIKKQYKLPFECNPIFGEDKNRY